MEEFVIRTLFFFILLLIGTFCFCHTIAWIVLLLIVSVIASMIFN